MDFVNRLKAAYKVIRNVPSRPKPAVENFETSRGAPSRQGDILSGKTVFISGVGPNIGRSLVLEMGRQGAHVVFTTLNSDGVADMEKECQSQQISSQGFVCDLRKVDDIEALCHVFDQQAISIDVMVHNAGLVFKENISLLDYDREEWVQTYETNVFGPMYLTKCIVERMRCHERPASLIFITSIQQFKPSGRTSYSSSKAALGMIVKELAGELGAFRIRVNGIAPGAVKLTDDGTPKPNRFVPLYKTAIPPEFIGRAAVFLASDFFSYCTTGTVLTVDGGLSLHNHHSDQLAYRRNKR